MRWQNQTVTLHESVRFNVSGKHLKATWCDLSCASSWAVLTWLLQNSPSSKSTT